MKKLFTNSQGFTVIELLVFILVLVSITVVGVSNVRSLQAQNRDKASKTDINAVYYQLESYYEKNGHYPETIDVAALKGIDPESVKDDLGKKINEEGGNYTYKPTGCSESKCKRFELTTQLEKEAAYTKESLNN
jgi:type II secretory pathway pseudopilin PulG